MRGPPGNVSDRVPVPVPRLYLITDRHATAGRPLTSVVAAALRGIEGSGLSPRDVAVQLRERDLSGYALVTLARTLRALTATAGVALYVNDRVDVALAVGADGVHLGGGALPPADVGRIAPGLALAVSTHGPDDVTAALASGARLTFAVFGPIRATPSKEAYGPPLGTSSLAEAARLGLPLVALGGMTPDDVPTLRGAGAQGVACIRAVMSAPDPAAVVAAFCEHLSSAPDHLRSAPDHLR